MKYVNNFKMFESKNKQIVDGVDDNDLFADVYRQNTLHKTHDFYIFIYKDGFKELEDGNFKKILEIENMYRLEPDGSNHKDTTSMHFRARMNQSNVGQIWWPKEGRDLVDGLSSDDMDIYILDLIEKHMTKGSSKEGIDIFNHVKDKYKKMTDFNL